MSAENDLRASDSGAARVHLRAAARTHVGLVREANEDNFLARTDDSLWVVADGMGGHDAGEVASKATVDAMDKITLSGDIQARASTVESCMHSVNGQLRALSDDNGGRTVGTTVVALAVHEADAACAWAGDSRLYRVREGELQQLTDDHALVQELVRIGAMTPEAARNHPAANLVTRALGAETTLIPEVLYFDVQAGDLLVLCSDGLTDDAIAAANLADCADMELEALVDKLIESALDDGGIDNVTVICVRAELDA